MVELDKLVGVKEVAELAGVKSNAVSNWRKRHADFPRSVTSIRPLFDRDEILRWLEKRRGNSTQEDMQKCSYCQKPLVVGQVVYINGGIVIHDACCHTIRDVVAWLKKMGLKE